MPQVLAPNAEGAELLPLERKLLLLEHHRELRQMRCQSFFDQMSSLMAKASPSAPTSPLLASSNTAQGSRGCLLQASEGEACVSLAMAQPTTELLLSARLSPSSSDCMSPSSESEPGLTAHPHLHRSRGNFSINERPTGSGSPLENNGRTAVPLPFYPARSLSPEGLSSQGPATCVVIQGKGQGLGQARGSATPKANTRKVLSSFSYSVMLPPAGGRVDASCRPARYRKSSSAGTCEAVSRGRRRAVRCLAEVDSKRKGSRRPWSAPGIPLTSGSARRPWGPCASSGSQTSMAVKRVPGSGCRMPHDEVYMDSMECSDEEALDNTALKPVFAFSGSGLSARNIESKTVQDCDPVLPSQFSTSSAGFSHASEKSRCLRRVRSQFASSEEQAEGRATPIVADNICVSRTGLPGPMPAPSSEGKGVSVPSACAGSAPAAESNASALPGSAAEDSATKVFPCFSSADTCEHLVTKWIPPAKAPQLTTGAQSHLPVIFSDYSPSEACTSSASDCDDLRTRPLPPGISPGGAPAATVPTTAVEPLLATECKAIRATLPHDSPARTPSSSDYWASDVCTSSASECEDSLRGERSRVPGTRPQTVQQVVIYSGTVLNAAQLILARKLRRGAKPPAPEFSDYTISDYNTSSASESEASFKISAARSRYAQSSLSLSSLGTEKLE